MNNQIPAKLTYDEARAVREWAEHIVSAPDTSLPLETAAARVVLDVVLAPTRPTLADMTDEERRACQWMLADVEDHSRRYVIANPSDEEGYAVLIGPDGEIKWIFPEYVTPRPDLPRMEWPSTEKPAPAPALPDGFRLADHPDHGRVIVTTPKDSVLEGTPIIVPYRVLMTGAQIVSVAPDTLTFLDGHTPDHEGAHND